MRYADRETLEEVQRRRQQVINYLETVIQPNDESSQRVIETLKAQMANDRTLLAELNRVADLSASSTATESESTTVVVGLPRNPSSYKGSLHLATVSL